MTSRFCLSAAEAAGAVTLRLLWAEEEAAAALKSSPAKALRHKITRLRSALAVRVIQTAALRRLLEILCLAAALAVEARAITEALADRAAAGLATGCLTRQAVPVFREKARREVRASRQEQQSHAQAVGAAAAAGLVQTVYLTARPEPGAMAVRASPHRLAARR